MRLIFLYWYGSGREEMRVAVVDILPVADCVDCHWYFCLCSAAVGFFSQELYFENRKSGHKKCVK